MDLRLKKFSIPRHLLTNFEIQKYYQNEPRFSGIILENMQMSVHIRLLCM